MAGQWPTTRCASFHSNKPLDPPEWDESGIQFLPPNLNQELQSPESSRNDRAASVL
jgi:hypothetical protein